MPITVRMPDGRVAQFPDGTPPETIQQALQGIGGEPAPASVATPGFDPGATAHHLLSGIGKGAGSSFAGLGELATKLANLMRRSPESGWPTEPFNTAQREMRPNPDSPAEQLGFGAEQLGEFFAPGGAARTPLRLAGQEALRAGIVGSAQQGEPDLGSAVAAGGLAGSAAKVSRMAPFLKDRAARLLERTLHPTTKLRGEVAAAAPHALEQMGFSEIAAKTPEQLARSFGKEFDEVQQVRSARIATEGKRGSKVDLRPVWDELVALEGKLKVGEVIPDPASYKAVVERMQTLRQVFEEHGGTQIPIETVDRLRSIFAKPLWKTGAPPADLLSGSQQGSAKLIADSIRKQVAEQFPDIGALGTEAHQFGTLRRAAKAESLASRTRAPQKAGEVLALRALGAGIGGTAGYQAGGGPGAAGGMAIGATVPFAVLRLINSPRWMTLSAASQHRLGSLIESGKLEDAGKLAARLWAGTAGRKDTGDEE